jgi:hypothetical protein
MVSLIEMNYYEIVIIIIIIIILMISCDFLFAPNQKDLFQMPNRIQINANSTHHQHINKQHQHQTQQTTYTKQKNKYKQTMKIQKYQTSTKIYLCSPVFAMGKI